jgi:hypothetical protein
MVRLVRNSMGRTKTEHGESVPSLKFIERFHARGMRRLHAFDVRFAGRRRNYSGEIWATTDGRLLCRFHCPTESDFDEAHEIVGMTISDLVEAELNATAAQPDDVWLPWVPPCVRERWELWLSSVI